MIKSRIRELRKSRNLTVRELAARVGVSEKQAWTWETHTAAARRPNALHTERLCRALGCSIGDLAEIVEEDK